MSIENVRIYLQQFNLDNRIKEFTVSSATVELAAEALNCEPCRIAKTLAFKQGEETVVIVMSGDCKIDNAKYKQYFHLKAKMLTPDETLAATGHAVGGVCPFALPAAVKTYLDVSLKHFSTVFPACGSANSAIEITPEELERYTSSPVWIDVCKSTIQ